MNLPDDVEWFFWRLVTSDRLKETKHTVENCWTLIDCLDAHQVLDAIEEAQAHGTP